MEKLAIKQEECKQCSNCQKSPVPYYCCLTAAYCDSKCQKEDWNQHIRVCSRTKDVERCSNCRKKANYFCCYWGSWGTAYCDLDCQKVHWSQHKSVCANKSPKIMMQNEALNDYQSMVKGFDFKTETWSTYENSNNAASSSESIYICYCGKQFSTKPYILKHLRRKLLKTVG